MNIRIFSPFCSKVIATVSLVCCLTTSGVAQTLIPVSENSEFAANLNGWNVTSDGASIVDANTGRGRAQLAGATGLWQYVPVSGISDFQMVHCNAYKALLSPVAGVAPGWAGIGIIYYDAQWGFIDSFEKQINVADGLDDFGSPKLVPCSLGVRVPPNAVHSIFWVANDPANSMTVVDDLYLLEYFPFLPLRQVGPKLDTHSQFLNDVYGKVYRTSGLEFWDIQGMIDIGTGALGNAGSPCSISQEVRLRAGKSYRLSWLSFPGFVPSIPITNVGVDFFDANWNRIGGTFKTTSFFSTNLFDDQLIEVPEGTAHSILWVWTDSLTANDGNQQVPGLSFEFSLIDNVPPTITLAKPLADLGTNDRGLKILLTFADNTSGEPFSPNFIVSLFGPNGKEFFVSFSGIERGDDPLKSTIILRAFSNDGSEIVWSNEDTGTYTLRVPPEGFQDESGNFLASGLTATFEVTR